MKIAVSACLIGENCKYNGGNNMNPELLELLKENETTAVCPEVMGGLSVPRPPAEIVNGVVINSEGENVDAEYRSGAALALKKILEEKCQCVVLQSRSPSCGLNVIYDGTFSHVRIPGNGVFAQLCSDAGIPCFDVAEMEKIRRFVAEE